MKLAILGAGGVGGYFGGKLARAGVDVTFLVRGATLAALRERELRVDSVDGDFAVRVKATDDPAALHDVDALITTVKAWQLAEAARPLAPHLRDDAFVVPLENGIDAPDELAHIFGPHRVLGGLCAVISYIVTSGHIRHAGGSTIVMFGELDNRRSERALALQEHFVRAGIKCEVPPDIHRSMWTKFLFITPLSGIGAITRVPVGIWRAMPETRAMAERMLHEIHAIADARGIALDPNAIEVTLQRYDALPVDGTASMQRDVMEGKPSELEAQLGAVVRLGRHHGVPTPVTELVYQALLPQERQARA